MGAQVLAGLSQTGIPAPNGRTIHPTEAELRGFFDELWNNAIRPPIENALSGNEKTTQTSTDRSFNEIFSRIFPHGCSIVSWNRYQWCKSWQT